MSTPQHRAARRDYWNDPAIVRWARGLDYTLGGLACVLFMLAGSIQNFH
jgi:hypothetical protein